MKTLILTCHTGDGHNAAARAVAKEFDLRGWEYRIADPIALRSPRASRVVCSCYNGLIRRTPRVFGAVYSAGAVADRLPLRSPVYYANGTYALQLQRYAEQEKFDRILCTHLFGMEAVTALRRRQGFSVPCYGVLTDYTCIPFLKETDLDGYFVPHSDLTDEMVAKGLPKQRIYPTGIPVDENFRKDLSSAEARAALSLPLNKKIALIMTGGVGCESMASLCSEMSRLEMEDLEVFVLVGRNEKLAGILNKTCPSVHTIPFTRQVPLYMKAADVILSKAGGLSSTEAAVAGVPLVHLKTIPGCESRNAEFFSLRGLSLQASTDRQAADGAKQILTCSQAAEAMRNAQKRQINPFAARDIADRMAEG